MYKDRIKEDENVQRMTYRIPSLKAYRGLKYILDNGGAIQSCSNEDWICWWGKIQPYHK